MLHWSGSSTSAGGFSFARGERTLDAPHRARYPIYVVAAKPARAAEAAPEAAMAIAASLEATRREMGFRTGDGGGAQSVLVEEGPDVDGVRCNDGVGCSDAGGRA